MTSHALLCRIALSRAKYVGTATAQALLEVMQTPENIFTSKSNLRQAFPSIRERLLDELFRPSLMIESERIAQWCVSEGIRTYFITDPDYPFRLAQCADAPILIYAKGHFSHWNTDVSLSVVGTRNISNYGLQMTNRLLEEVAQMHPRALIVSGLAYGIDIAAHRRALQLGLPTVAVLAHGFDRIYPAVHRQTALDILYDGAWVSEYPLGTNPDRFNFVGRNRIIAGLTDATLVVEAGLKSGSLITAELAADYDREVLAVPGRIGDRYSEGCNRVIADQRARLVTSGRDIADALGWEMRADGVMQQTLQFAADVVTDSYRSASNPSQVQPMLAGGDPAPKYGIHPTDRPIPRSEVSTAPIASSDPLLLLIAEHRSIHLNELIRLTGSSMQAISMRLLDLEMDGHIRALPGGLYSLV